jgi:enterochelin esterase-like enzyme
MRFSQSAKNPFPSPVFLAAVPLILVAGCSALHAPTPAGVLPTATGTPVPSLTAFPATGTSVSPTATVTPPPTPTPPPGCAQTRGRMETDSIVTELQPWPVDLLVYLPPCYDPARFPGYPLLILLHGQTYTNDQWDRDGADEAADRLIADRAIPPLIIIMPNEAHAEQLPQKSNFDEVVAQAVLPWAESRYAVCPDRRCRAVGGISRGAGWAVHIGFQRPELFGSVGAHSYPVFFGDIEALQSWIAATPIAGLPRFYLDMGDGDLPEYIAANREFRTELTRLGVPFEWHADSGGHNDAYWSAHAEEYLIWYARAWAGLERQ